jgi:hypothetical protein
VCTHETPVAAAAPSPPRALLSGTRRLAAAALSVCEYERASSADAATGPPGSGRRSSSNGSRSSSTSRRSGYLLRRGVPARRAAMADRVAMEDADAARGISHVLMPIMIDPS